jgi:hypothetical protein
VCRRCGITDCRRLRCRSRGAISGGEVALGASLAGEGVPLNMHAGAAMKGRGPV